MPPPLTIHTLLDTGETQPFTASGIRVPLTAHAWAAIDFDSDATFPIIIPVAVRTPRAQINVMPELLLRPRSGNAIRTLIGSAPPADRKPLNVIPIQLVENQIERRALLSRITSGDLAEEMLQTPPPSLAATRFEISYGSIASVEIALSSPDNALLAIDISTRSFDLNDDGNPYPMLRLTIHPNAANLVSFHFHPIMASSTR